MYGYYPMFNVQLFILYLKNTAVLDFILNFSCLAAAKQNRHLFSGVLGIIMHEILIFCGVIKGAGMMSEVLMMILGSMT